MKTFAIIILLIFLGIFVASFILPVLIGVFIFAIKLAFFALLGYGSYLVLRKIFS